MVKFKKIILMVLVVFLVVGCMDYNVGFNINKDKSLDLSMESKVDLLKFMHNLLQDEELKKSFLEQSATTACSYTCDALDEDCMNKCVEENTKNATLTDEDIKKYLDDAMSSDDALDESYNEEEIKALTDKGFTVDESLDKESYVYTLSIKKHYNNIDDVSSDKEVSASSVDINKLFAGEAEEVYFTKTSEGNYKANFVVGESTVNESDFVEFDLDDVDLKGLMSITYTVTLPNGAISNNASEVSSDKKTLTWDLSGNDVKEINYEFSLNDSENKENTVTDNNKSTNNTTNILGLNISDTNLRYISYGLMGGGLLVAVIATLIFVKSNKKNKMD